MVNRERLASRKLSWLSSVLFLGATTEPAVAAEKLFPDLTESVQRLRFHDGLIANNRPEISPVLPAMPGPPSPWYVIQWRRPTLLRPTDLQPRIDAPASSAEQASFNFVSTDGNTRVTIRPKPNGATYELFEHNGTLVKGGGSNLFLSADALRPIKMDREIDYSISLRVTAADARYDDADAQRSGAVLATAFSGFRLQLHAPGVPPTSLFLQIQHVTSRNTPADHVACTVDFSGHRRIVYSRTLTGERFAAFRPSHAAFTVTARLRHYLLDLIGAPLSCTTLGGSEMVDIQRESGKNLNRWELTSAFIGIEIQNTDQRNIRHPPEKHGDATLGIEVLKVAISEKPATLKSRSRM